MYNKRPRGEIVAAARIVQIALDEGYSITVHDGEEIALRKSRDDKAILSAMGETDSDTLHLYEPSGVRIGAFALIYGNAPNGTELVADHTDNATMDAMWNTWSMAQEAWAERRGE